MKLENKHLKLDGINSYITPFIPRGCPLLVEDAFDYTIIRVTKK